MRLVEEVAPTHAEAIERGLESLYQALCHLDNENIARIEKVGLHIMLNEHADHNGYRKLFKQEVTDVTA